MPVEKGSKREYFPRVREAREAIRERAIELFESYLALSAEARAAGKFEVAEKILWNLMDHVEEEDGTKMFGQSVDKPKAIDPKSQGPSIQIGIQLGGMDQTKALPPQIIEVTPIKDE